MRRKIIWTVVFGGGALLLAGAVLLASFLTASPAPAARAVAAQEPAGCMTAVSAVDNAKLVIGGMSPGNMQASLLGISRRLGQAARSAAPAVSADLDLASMYSARLALDAGQPDSQDFTVQLAGFKKAQQGVLDTCGAP
jgi:hypothetical protein